MTMSMNGTCFFCGKPLSVRQRHVYCSERCQALHAHVDRRGRESPADDRMAAPNRRAPLVRPIRPTRRSA